VRPLLLLLLALGPCGVGAYEAVVSHVTDGDTVRLAGRGSGRLLRLHGIDAPELCQDHGPQAREALAAKLLGQRVQVSSRGRDPYGRTLAQVHLRGEDVGAWMVRHGHAWSYRAQRQPSPYAQEQRLARSRGDGLWRSPQPMQPRLFRRFQGDCRDGR
jgi:micrococcal nuclease